MTSNVMATYKEMKQRLEGIKSKRERLLGRKEQILAELKEKHGVASMKEAKRTLEIANTRLERVEKEIQANLDVIERHLNGTGRGAEES